MEPAVHHELVVSEESDEPAVHQELAVSDEQKALLPERELVEHSMLVGFLVSTPLYDPELFNILGQRVMSQLGEEMAEQRESQEHPVLVVLEVLWQEVLVELVLDLVLVVLVVLVMLEDLSEPI